MIIAPGLRWYRAYGRSTLLCWDFCVALVAGSGVALLSAVDSIREQAVPILLAEGAVGVAITATVFGALAVFTTFFDAGYRRVIEQAGGFQDALMPYVTVCTIAGGAGVLGIAGALVLPACSTAAAAVVMGVPSLLCTWSVTGTISLASITAFHARQRAALMSGADSAATELSRRRAS